MYITERLFGVVIYSFLLFVFFLLIYFSKSKHIGKFLLLYTVLLSFLAYLYVPNTGSDLYRLIPIMQMYATNSFSQIIELAFNTNTSFAMIYMYLIGKTKVDSLLPAITAFIVFYNIFSIINRASLRYSYGKQNTALVLLFLMSTGFFIEAISGIRTMLAFSIIAICFYKETIENKSLIRNLIFYFISALMHPSALFLVLIRLIFVFFQKESSGLKKMFSYIVGAIIIAFLSIYGISYIEAMIEKGQQYFTENRYRNTWEYLIGSMSLMIIIITQLTILNINRVRKINDNIINLYKFSLLLSLICIVTFIEYNTFHRFVIFTTIISSPLVIYVLSNEFISKKYRNYYKISILATSLVILLIASSRGNLSSLKFFIN